MRWLLATMCVCGATTFAAAATQVQWGQDGDVPVPFDFDGDGHADYVVWRPSDGTWWVKSSATAAVLVSSLYWGLPGDIPVPADYDGDGHIDFAVWRPSEGNWYVLSGLTLLPLLVVQWGLPGDDPVPGDYDGDGRAEFSVWRPSTGEWFLKSSTISPTSFALGTGLATPIPGDYDAARGADLTRWQPGLPHWDGSHWHTGASVWGSTSPLTHQASAPTTGGQLGDVPTAAHFCTDTISRTIWHPDDGTWLTPNQATLTLGQPGDIPVPANFSGDRFDEVAVWRPATGTWYIDSVPCDGYERVRVRIDLATAHVAGLAVAAVKNGQIVLAYGAGMANLTTPATADVPWQIASVSKLFIGTAILRAIDEGFNIDPDAPTTAANPINGAMPLLRQFANHTSGLQSQVCYAIGNFDPSPDLQAATTCLGDPGIWRDQTPGTAAEYSNIGATWAARVLETATGIGFNPFTRSRIFTPLQMTSTGWFRSDFGSRQDLAIGMSNGVPSTATGATPYAMGNLRASARDLGKFMVMWTDVPSKRARVLSSQVKSYAFTAHDPGNPDGGFFWWRSYTTSGHTMWAHGGVLPAVCTRLDVDPLARTGIAILTNGSCLDANADINAIEDLAFRNFDGFP